MLEWQLPIAGFHMRITYKDSVVLILRMIAIGMMSAPNRMSFNVVVSTEKKDIPPTITIEMIA